MATVSTSRVPLLDPTTKKIPAKYLPADLTTPAALTLGTGLVVPSWGATPAVVTGQSGRRLSGHVGAGATSLTAGAVLITGATWTAGVKTVAVSSTGTVLLQSTATTLTIGQILVGAAPDWISLDGVVV